MTKKNGDQNWPAMPSCLWNRELGMQSIVLTNIAHLVSQARVITCSEGVVGAGSLSRDQMDCLWKCKLHSEFCHHENRTVLLSLLLAMRCLPSIWIRLDLFQWVLRKNVFGMQAKGIVPCQDKARTSQLQLCFKPVEVRHSHRILCASPVTISPLSNS